MKVRLVNEQLSGRGGKVLVFQCSVSGNRGRWNKVEERSGRGEEISRRGKKTKFIVQDVGGREKKWIRREKSD